NRVEIFDDAGTGPIDVGAVFKNYIDERLAEHRFAPDKLHFRRGNKSSRNRVRELVFHQIGRASLPIGINDYLNVAQIGNRIERSLLQRIDAGTDRKKSENKYEKSVPDACFDDAFDRWPLLA